MDVSKSYGELGAQNELLGPTESTSPRLRTTENKRESVSASKLYRDISPTRVFTMRNKELSLSTLPDLFKQKGGLQSLRPAYLSSNSDEGTDATRAPRLLARLEMLLAEKLNMVNRVGAASKGFAATQMRTDAYRQVFDAFLHSFTTYRAVLMRIKHEYDEALDDALASVYDNVHMRAELSAAEEMMDACVAEAKAKSLEDATIMRQELEDQYRQQEQVALQAEMRCHESEAEIQSRRESIVALKKEAADLIAQNRAIKQKMLENSSWSNPRLLKMYENLPGDSGKT
ncbi:hypothetical protein CEUSTIGMA_g4796.t1 [Chlamydomonas eustigma]|uniref:Translin-associated factor X-interacting protein 1 N-terminal domain-containing protein n=1 Tax=Chlamydomonas eustigma TaxID=1157962 RepID=A0A250X3K4_9CHLO|nr:hypothetical protein CEUSTIGMA_g4796.t1 [Chlamydomonas eustigma]|eukprot:GAX77350.1 hypothetical protein CEUSTIGMA_g4796.t1 [Chlamydomonas eustigma]